MKKTIKLTESKLHEIIMEAARNMIQESYAEARPNSQRLIDLIDEGVIDVKRLAYNLIDWMGDNEVGRFAESEGYFEDENLEDEEEDEEEDAIDFYEFVDILEKNGWGYHDYQQVSNDNGDSGCRYILSKDTDNATPIEKVVDQVKKKAVFPEGIILGNTSYKNAPEINYPSIIILSRKAK